MSEESPATILLVSLDWEEALISYSLPAMSFVEVTVGKSGPTARTTEENAVGRVRLSGLKPERDYEADVRWEGGTKHLAFRTLPAPAEPLRASWAAVADTHVSDKQENRKGRLFVESASILRDMVEEWNVLGLDGVLIAGDVTDRGQRQEYEMARDALKGLACPLLAAPGDHDVRGDYGLWNEFFGADPWMRQMGGFAAIALDTHAGYLKSEGCQRIEKALALDTKMILILSHLQLFPDDYIRFGKQKAVLDHEENGKVLDELARRQAVVYVGHQNVPSRMSVGRLTQVNLPQPSQFPCGWVLARVYGSRVYHTYRPIRSEVLNNYSRVASNAAAGHYKEPQWGQDYRMGPHINSTNFTIELAPEGDCV